MDDENEDIYSSNYYININNIDIFIKVRDTFIPHII